MKIHEFLWSWSLILDLVNILSFKNKLGEVSPKKQKLSIVQSIQLWPWIMRGIMGVSEMMIGPF